MTTRTTITVATESFLMLLGSSRARAWCPHCAADREMFLLEQVRSTGRDPAQTIDSWLVRSGAHRVALSDGSSLFCLARLGGVQNANHT